MKRVLIQLTLAYAQFRHCPGPASNRTHEYLSEYQPYNLALGSVDLEFTLDYNLTIVRSNITVTKYKGGDVILNGSDLIKLDDISIIYNRIANNSLYSLKRQLKNSICLDADHNLIIEAADIPAEANLNGFTISVQNHLNPEANTHLFGLYRSRNLLITQNESSGFRRITYYPDRPDVLAVFRTTMKADVRKFPVLLSNGNEVSQSIENNILTVTYFDPYPKPSYLFALVAGRLVRIAREVTLGDSCWSALNKLVGPGYREHSLAKYCSSSPKRFEDIVISKFALANATEAVGSPLRALKDSDDKIKEGPAEESLSGSLRKKLSSFPDYVSSLFYGASDLLSDAWVQARDNVVNTAKATNDLINIQNLSNQRKASESATVAGAAAGVGSAAGGGATHTFGMGRMAPTPAGATTGVEATHTFGVSQNFCPQLELEENWSGILNYEASRTSDICPWRVLLRIWAEENTVKLEQLEWALESAYQAMLYDEVRFGRYYDLSEFSIVAALDFNAGAMENKGLNIFNEALILADPFITTDSQYERIRGVIAHEYFHNWSGDRVTIRDWFQLTLKEGFTVFRDQSFTEDLSQSSLMKRLRDIDLMETIQFTQDATPMAHPIRPNQYQTVENFYTVTVYEKGAEVIRMYQTLLGPKAFRKATDLFFKSNMDKAATCEDFLSAVKQVAAIEPSVRVEGVDWDRFFSWYTQAGTPTVEVTKIHWSSTTQQLKLTLSQHIRQYSGGGSLLVIPIKISLIDPIDLTRYVDNEVFVLQRKTDEIVFNNVLRRPVISILRGFSAPVKIDSFQSDSDLAFLAVNDDCPYIRFKSFDQLVSNEIRRCLIRTNVYYKQLDPISSMNQTIGTDTCPLERGFVNCEISPHVKSVYERLLISMLKSNNSESLLAQLLALPKLSRLKTSIKPYEPAKIHAAIRNFKRQVLDLFGGALLAKFSELDEFDAHSVLNTYGDYDHSPERISARALKTSILHFLLLDATEDTIALAVRQLERNAHANDVHASLFGLAGTNINSDVQILLGNWLKNHQHDGLLTDRWFASQMSWPHIDCYDRFKTLLGSELYANSKNPNRLRALARTFATNSVAFHQQRSYELVASEIIRWDQFNPKLAAGLASTFNELSLVNEALKIDGLTELERILAVSSLSKNTREVVTSIKEKIVLDS